MKENDNSQVRMMFFIFCSKVHIPKEGKGGETKRKESEEKKEKF